MGPQIAAHTGVPQQVLTVQTLPAGQSADVVHVGTLAQKSLHPQTPGPSTVVKQKQLGLFGLQVGTKLPQVSPSQMLTEQVPRKQCSPVQQSASPAQVPPPPHVWQAPLTHGVPAGQQTEPQIVPPVWVPTQTPFWQLSFCVQGSPSLQVVPLGLMGLLHWPVLGLQVPASWHWSSAVHWTGLPPTQVPFWHVSVCVQALPSLQVAPFGLAGLVHWPVVGLQTPATWHWSSAVQTGMHAPAQGMVPAGQVHLYVVFGQTPEQQSAFERQFMSSGRHLRASAPVTPRSAAAPPTTLAVTVLRNCRRSVAEASILVRLSNLFPSIFFPYLRIVGSIALLSKAQIRPFGISPPFVSARIAAAPQCALAGSASVRPQGYGMGGTRN